MANPLPIKNRSRVIICGGGVIGASIAYFLSLRNVEAVVVEVVLTFCEKGPKSISSGLAGLLDGIGRCIATRLLGPSDEILRCGRKPQICLHVPDGGATHPPPSCVSAYS